jgi:hypothetical protein
MKTFKLKKDRITGAIHIALNGRNYKPYLIGNLPSLFAFKVDIIDDKEGISEWFNYKGFTYVPA